MSVKRPLEQMSILAILGLLMFSMLYGFLALIAFITPSSLPPGYSSLGQSSAGYPMYELLVHLYAILTHTVPV